MSPPLSNTLSHTSLPVSRPVGAAAVWARQHTRRRRTSQRPRASPSPSWACLPGRRPQRAAPAQGQAPHLGEGQSAPLPPRPIALLLAGEGVVAPAPLQARQAGVLPSRHLSEERLGGLVGADQHVLPHRAVDRRLLWEGVPQLLQLRFLLTATDGAALAA